MNRLSKKPVDVCSNNSCDQSFFILKFNQPATSKKFSLWSLWLKKQTQQYADRLPHESFDQPVFFNLCKPLLLITLIVVFLVDPLCC
jgi:hypothetical protein